MLEGVWVAATCGERKRVAGAIVNWAQKKPWLFRFFFGGIFATQLYYGDSQFGLDQVSHKFNKSRAYTRWKTLKNIRVHKPHSKTWHSHVLHVLKHVMCSLPIITFERPPQLAMNPSRISFVKWKPVTFGATSSCPHGEWESVHSSFLGV